MSSLNKVMLIGNLGRDAELKYTPSGAALLNFRIATTEKFKDRNDEWKEVTEWHTVVLWGKRAEGVSEYMTKGKQVYVEGRLTTRSWEDKDGNKKYSTEVRADDVKLLGRAEGGGGQSRGGGSSRQQQSRDDDAQQPITDDDIPF